MASGSGQSVVELALVMPVLILILVGIVDFSRLLHGYVAATNAARVGAEVASDTLKSDDQVRAAVQRESSPSVTLSGITIAPSPRTTGSQVQIGVTYVFSPYTPLVSSFWGGGSLPLVAVAESRVY